VWYFAGPFRPTDVCLELIHKLMQLARMRPLSTQTQASKADQKPQCRPCAQALREADNANTAYSTALSLCQQLPEGWVSWGTHCDQMYQAQKNPVWLEYAVTCYLQVGVLTLNNV